MNLNKIEFAEEQHFREVAPDGVTLSPEKTAPAPQIEEKETTNEAEAELTTRFLKQRQHRLDRQVLKLAQALIQRGYKVTDPRLEILEAITTFDNGFNLNELLERVGEQAQLKGTPPPGTASVFRAVKLLTEELGLLQRVHSGDGCHRYALQRGHQHQVVCRCCERTIEFEGCDFGELTHFLEEKTGFRLEGHWMEFFGLCDVCRQAQPEGIGEGTKTTILLPHEHPHAHEEGPRPEPLNVREVSQ